MEESNPQNTKQKGQGKPQKKNIDKGDDKLFLLGNINSNVNVFSQLSNMYQAQEDEGYSGSTQNTMETTKKPESKHDPVYQAFIQSQKSFDFEITKILNKLNKKSETTKLRALGELKTVLNERDEEFYKTFFSTWLYIYKQLVTSEFDKKLLEECNNILLVMAPKLKKNLAPFIKELFPLWFLSMNDPNNEVSQVATKAFEQTFPENRRPNVLAMCGDNLIEHIRNTCRITPQKILEENSSLDEAQVDEVYDRNILSALSAASSALKLNTKTEDPSKFINKIVELFSLDQQLKGNSLLLGFLHNKKRPRVRAGAIELIDSLLAFIDMKILEKNISNLTTIMLDLLDDKDRSVQRSLWKGCILKIMKTATLDPNYSEKIELRKYENKVLFTIKTAGSGLGALLYNNLVEFFSYLESFSAKDFQNVFEKVEDRISFYRKFFSNILLAYGHEEVRFFGNELTNSYFECALFCIIKRIIPLCEEAKSSSKNYEANLKTIRNFIKELLIIPCQEYIKKYSKTTALSPHKNIPSRIGDVLSHIEIKSELQQDNIFLEFEKEFYSLFERNIKSFNELNNFFGLLQGCIKVSPSSALYTYFQDLIHKCNQYFQNEIKNSFLAPDVIISDSLLEKKFEELEKIESFNSIFVFDPSLNNVTYYSLIEENFSNLVDLAKKFLTNFEKVIKVFNIEKFAKFIMKTISNMLFLYYKSHETLGTKENLEKKLSELITCLSHDLNNPHPYTGLNLHNLILISFLFNPASVDNYFSEFVSYNNNKASEDQLLNRALENYIKKSKDEKAYHFSKNQNQSIQNLVQTFATKVLSSDKYRAFAPSICHVLLFSAQEKTIQEIIRTISSFLKDLTANKGKLTIEFDKLEPLFSSLVILIKTRSLSSIESSEIELCFSNLIKILFSLYSGSGTSRKRALIIYDLLKRVPAQEKLAQNSNFKGLREYILDSLHSGVSAQLEVNLVKKEAKDKLKVDNLVKMVEDYLSFVLYTGANKHVTQFYEELLSEKFFQHSMVAPDIWRILMTSLETTHHDFETKKVFSIKADNKLNPKFYWLLIEMISVVNANALLSNLREKKFFTLLSNDFFIHELLTEMESTNEENLQNVLDFLEFALNKTLEKSLIYTLGVKKLLKTYIANSKDSVLTGRIFDSLLVKNLKIIASEVSKPEIDSASLFKRAIVHKNLLSVFEKFVPENQEKWADASRSFQENIQNIVSQGGHDFSQLTRFLINLDVFGSMVSLNPKLMIEDELLDRVIKYTFKHVKIEDLKQGKIEPNFTLNTLFEFINLVIETKTFTPLSDNILQIESFFLFGLEYNKEPKNYSSSALVKINMFFRKVLVYMEIFSEGFKEKAFEGLLRTCKTKVNEISNQNDKNYANEEFYLSNEINETMLTEFAETISRMTIAIDQSLDEVFMYDLFDCNIPSIQKSAFVLLKHFYENFAVKLSFGEVSGEKLEEDKTYVNELFLNKSFVPLDMKAVISNYHQKEKEFLKKEEDVLDEEEDVEDLGEKYLLGFKNQGFLLTWISLLLKLKLQAANSSSDVENIYKRAFINYFNRNPEVYTGLLDIVFSWLKTLNLNLAQQRDILNSKDYDLGTVSLEWEDFSSYEGLFRIILQFLYLFITKFPKFFGKWYSDTLKQNQREVESLIKNFISNTLFNDEKNLIEAKQHEWKTDEFNIFVMKSTRQILASYMKEGSKLEISITVPEDYPISQIQIECQKGVKIPGNKLNKYLLMMRTILVNENDTFLSALMLWKSNIDKEFEGVEECAICYYVVHSSTRDLPKLPCKTCKHKFHSVCIHKWFESSNKSECPLCKSQFW